MTVTGAMTASAPALKYLWYGDDFTGASDTLATFAKAGLKALLCLGVPDATRLSTIGPLDALGLAGAARTMSPEAMVEELEPVGRYAAATGVPILHYKCCSTFDSALKVGSIGAAMRMLRPHLKDPLAVVVAGQPSLGRYCAFGNLFAAAGAGGEVFRLDRHPTMSHHPVTPMHEADLRRHLALQFGADIGLIDWRSLAAPADADIEAVLEACAVAPGSGAVLFDALETAHLDRIGRLIWRRARTGSLLVVGASSVAEAIIAQWRAIGLAPIEGPTARVLPARGPVFILAGSQSPVTARQIAHALSGGADAAFEGILIDGKAAAGDPAAIEAVVESCVAQLTRGHSVLAYTGPVVDGGQPKLDVARASGRLLAHVVDRAPMVARIGIAGGDTSSLAVKALDLWALGFVGTLSPGVTLVRAHADDRRRDGLELMLKGGQMGSVDLFTRLRDGIALGAATKAGGVR
jgi:uncharacterized protein YgbK (DUF1537 family)